MEEEPRDIKLSKLTERAKELKCMYQVLEAMQDESADLMTVFKAVLEAIPPGYQYPTVCEACIILEGEKYASPDFVETQWMQKAEIVIDSHVAGEIQVSYLIDVFGNNRVFLPEEQKLLNAIADHISRFIFFKRLKKTMESSAGTETGKEYRVAKSLLQYESDEHWKWRYQLAEKIAEMTDMEKYGVNAIYLIGSTKNGTAGPGSDIDLLIHLRGDPDQEKELRAWIEGWGLGLSELNYFKTGYEAGGSLIDVHVITDEDIRNKSSYAVMIGASQNSAKLLRILKPE